MFLIEKGNYKLPDWSMEARCTGAGCGQKHKPCYSKWKLEDGDIVKRKFGGEICYGFICPDCHCFTILDETELPDNVKAYCLQVAAKGSKEYEELTEKEKILSEGLLK